MQSAKLGQTEYVPHPPYTRQLMPAASSRSMIVGIQGTGEGVYGPDPSDFGMHDGTETSEPPDDIHHALALLSQPHVGGPKRTPATGSGFSPVKPSIRAAPRSRWAPQLGTESVSKVRSEMAKARTSAARLGIWSGWYW